MSHPSQAQHGLGASPALTMKPLPILDGSDVRPPLSMQDWIDTLPATVEEARNAAYALRELVHDAVYLDEECYSSAVHHTQYQDKMHIQQKRLHGLENEGAALRDELERKDELLAAAATRQRESQRQISELQQELENNAVVFKMHYQELLTRNQEIERLKAVIEALQNGP